MSAYFVTATGTDIGKTFVTAGLVRRLREIDREAHALKPVVSGFTREAAVTSDSGVLLEALGQPVTDETLDAISPWRFAAPLSPDMAAAREGRTVDFDGVVQFCRDAIATHRGTLFIEGVGGVMVPLDARHTVLDWIAALAVPTIVVAGTYLGTISHTLTALDVLARRGIKVAALVLNQSTDSPVPPAETIASLVRFAPIPSIVTLQRAPSPIEAKRAFDSLLNALS